MEEKICASPTIPDGTVSTPGGKGARPEGQQNMQDSTFSISGNITCFSCSWSYFFVFTEDSAVERKSCVRVRNPPGGKSAGFW